MLKTHGDGGLSRIFGGCDVGSFDSKNDSVHQVLGCLDKGSGAVEAGNDEFAADILYVSFDFARDVHLMAIKSDALKISE